MSFTQSTIVLRALHTPTMDLSDKRLAKILQVCNGAFVSLARIVMDKECTATGSVEGGYGKGVDLQAARSRAAGKNDTHYMVHTETLAD